MLDRLWVTGWSSEGLLIIGTAVALWHGLSVQASIYVTGAMIIGVIRSIERARRDRDGPPPGRKV